MGHPVKIMGGIISYPVLFNPKPPKGSDKPRYGCSIILPENYDWSEVQKAVADATAEKWGSNPPGNLKSQISTVDGGPYAGRWAISATASIDYPPTVVDQQVQPIMNQADIFAGCLCNFQVSFFAYDTGSNGVSCGVNIIQLVSNVGVTRLDGAQNAADVFGVIEQPMQQQPMQQQPMQQQPMQQQPMQQQPMQQQPMQQPAQQQPMQDANGVVTNPVAAPAQNIPPGQQQNPW